MPSETAQVDGRLLGDWIAKNEDRIHFSAKDAHWMQVTITPKISDATTHPSMVNRNPETYDLYCTTLGVQTFLNVRIAGKDTQGRPSTGYVFYRYKVAPDQTLHSWIMSADETADAIRAGELKGTIHQDAHPLMAGNPPHPDVNVHLTDSSENLVKFITRKGALDLFGDEGEPLTRVATKGD